MKSEEARFFERRPIIGMVHLAALPGSPHYGGDLEDVYDRAASDLEALARGGVSAAIIENFGDVPYTTRPELTTLLAMDAIAARLRQTTDLPLGINVQFNCAEVEWGMALACGCQFVRVETLVENRAGAFGITGAQAPELTRLAARHPADVMLFADISVKHSFEICPQTIEASVDAALEAGASALILTGTKTGKSPDLSEAREFRKIAGMAPVILGSGANEGNIGDFMRLVDGVIVGSSIKRDGVVTNPVDVERTRRLVEAARA